jgi:hypothetical protein
MSELKAGDKVKVIGFEEETYWYANKVGNIYTLKSFDGVDWSVQETDYGVFSPNDIEFYQDEKEYISNFLKENKWFIRTGNPEKSKLVQEWLFEHGIGWRGCGEGFTIYGTYHPMLTNTCGNDATDTIMWSADNDKTVEVAQEIKLEFETVIKSVKLPEPTPKEPVLTEQQIKIAQLEDTIAKASAQINQLKEMK